MKRSKVLVASMGLLVLALVMSGCLGLFAKTGEISVTVTYDDETPIAGADVKLGNASGKTDASGKYTFKAIKQDSYKLTVTLGGEVVFEQSVEVSAKPLHVPVVVEKGEEIATVSGIVSWEDDASPIAGATVNVAGISTKTDAHGEFTLEAVPFGTWTYTVTMNTTELASEEVTIEGDPFVLDVSVVRPEAIGTIIYQSDEGGNWQVYRANGDGTEIVQIIQGPDPHSHPRVSLDGQLVVFEWNLGGKYALYTMDIDGGNVKQLTSGEHDARHPALSADGQYITFHGKAVNHTDWEIYTMKSDGTELTRLTESSGTDAWPFFSPDGRQIVFSSVRDGDTHVFIMNADGSNVRRISQDGKRNEKASWSPDGRSVAYASNRDGNWEIYVADVETGEERRMTNDPKDDLVPVWSPDGSKILFTSNRDGTNALYTMDAADGSNVERLISGEKKVEYGSWGW